MCDYASNSLHRNVDILCSVNDNVDLCRGKGNQGYDVMTSFDINDILQNLCTN